MSEKVSLTLVGNNAKPAKIHNLIKAPANTPWAKEKQQSWDANKPATVYVTPETLPDGTPCSAVTVILRTKGCHWWWSSGCTFCGYFNDTRDDVTNENLHSQWELAKQKYDDFKDQQMVKIYTSGSLLEDREIPVEFQETVLRDCYDLGKELIVESRCEQLTEEKLSRNSPSVAMKSTQQHSPTPACGGCDHRQGRSFSISTSTSSVVDSKSNEFLVSIIQTGLVLT